MQLDRFPTEKEYKDLEDFLYSDETPDNCLNISEMDGFLTAIAIGPKAIPPSKWLPYVWDIDLEEEMSWESGKEADYYINLILMHYNSIVDNFKSLEVDGFQPIVYNRKSEGKDYIIIDDWCFGFMRAIAVSYDSWEPLLTDEECFNLIGLMVMHGTEEGWENRENDPEIKSIPNEELFELLTLSVIGIQKYWAEQRQSIMEEGKKTAANLKTGRNDPCPCGSGKKYKKCCGAK